MSKSLCEDFLDHLDGDVEVLGALSNCHSFEVVAVKNLSFDLPKSPHGGIDAFELVVQFTLGDFIEWGRDTACWQCPDRDPLDIIQLRLLRLSEFLSCDLFCHITMRFSPLLLGSPPNSAKRTRGHLLARDC